MDNMSYFETIRKQYPTFIYKNYEIKEREDKIILKFYFEIPGLTSFEPELVILKKNFGWNDIDTPFTRYLAFHIGLIELISYWKSVCCPNVIVQCGYLSKEQIKWFQKLYFYGLGEFFYTNHITTSMEEFMNLTCTIPFTQAPLPQITSFDGTIIPIGGGKDSVVTCQLLKNQKKTDCFIVNPKEVTKQCASLAGFSDEQTIEVIRQIDKNLLSLNQKGFLNGHTPFSSLLAFLSYFVAYLRGRKYIALSNESSANESNVEGLKVNHQYSKSYEFETDFQTYCKQYLQAPIHYFSFLRPLNELQIAMLFSRYEAYHPVFKSCNVGSKSASWKWCCNCPKCLFVYTILSPFLCPEKLIPIFGEDLFQKESLLDTFISLTGHTKNKPFECVGTYEEIIFAISKTISNLEKEEKPLPYLLQYYKQNYPLADLSYDLTTLYNMQNSLPKEFDEILRKEVTND